jgi:hypothetical protein
MGWSGGVYTKGNSATGGWTGDAASGIGIEAGRHDTQDNDFATGINTCLTKDGQNTPTANLPMAGFKHTGVANGSARTDYAAVGQVQDGDFVWLGTTGGTATAQTATASPSIGAYKAGQKFRMKVGAGLGSTGSTATAHTININSLGAKNLVNQDGTNPTLGTWVAAALLEVIYDGTNFVITNDPGGILSYTPTLTGNGSMTVSSVVIEDARFIKSGKIVTAWINCNFTTGGTGNTLNITMPVNSTGYTFLSIFPAINFDSVTVAGFIQLSAPPTFVVTKDVAGNAWGIGTNKYARFTISYTAV